jgi:hypothetical protein
MGAGGAAAATPQAVHSSPVLRDSESEGDQCDD